MWICTSYSTYNSLDMTGSICQNYRTALKTVTGSQPKNFTHQCLAPLAERQPRVRPAICTALLDFDTFRQRNFIAGYELEDEGHSFRVSP